jgi:L-alanine-DL-glutamate epimerase-like enolase superfamily enzyme
MPRPVLRTEIHELVLRTPFRLSRGDSTTRRNVVCTVEHAGSFGRGEAAPIARYREDADSASAALATMGDALEDVRAFSEEAARVAVAGQHAAQAALDAALHDLAARRLGISVRELLGVGRRPLPPTSFTIGLDPLDEVLAKVRESSAFEVLKVKMGAPGDVERVAAIREQTKQTIRVDANEGWAPAEAESKIAALARLGVEFVEQPLPAGRLEETRTLRNGSPLPFVADEDVHSPADVARLAGAYDGINLKLAKCGGISEALRLIAVARAHGLKILLGCMVESSLGIAAALAVAPLVDWIDLDGHLLISNDPFAGIGFQGGRLVPPDGIGLGVETRAPEGAA